MRGVIEKYGTAIAGLLLFLFFLSFARNFGNTANLLNVMKQTSFLVIIAIGFTFALITSELDLSFANIASLAAVVCGGLIYNGTAFPLAITVAVGIGLAGGLINGVLVTALKVPSLIATLGTASVANGLAFMLTDGVAFVGRWDKGFLWLARGDLFGVPALVIWTALAAGGAIFVLKKTPIGLHMLFTGEAAEAARLAGIRTRRIKVLGLTLSGLMAGVTAVLLTASLSSAAPNMAGNFLLTAMAAVLLGMTMFEPGRPNVLGTLVGAMIIGVMNNGLVLLGAPYYFQDIILGLIIVASVSLSASVLKEAAFSV